MGRGVNGLIALVILAGILLFLIRLGVLAYRYKTQGRVIDDGRTRIDGDRVYGDDRLNELLYARGPDRDREDDPPEFDLTREPTVTCSECHTRNRASFQFCRECAAELPD